MRENDSAILSKIALPIFDFRELKKINTCYLVFCLVSHSTNKGVIGDTQSCL